MKKTLSFLALAGTLALLPLGNASAHDHGRLVGYTPCGKPIYATHEVVGYDRCGRHIWQWVTHYPSSCHCREHHRDYDRCPPRYETPNYGHCRTGGWSFYLRF